MHFEMFGASVLVGLMSGWLAGIAMKGGGYGQALPALGAAPSRPVPCEPPPKTSSRLKHGVQTRPGRGGAGGVTAPAGRLPRGSET